MKLSPLELRKQQFTKTLRGYDPEEVKAFLEMMARQWEEVIDELRRNNERVRELESKLKHYERVEEALQEAVQTARENARRSQETAEQRAKLLLEEAEIRAQRILHDAEHERYAVKQDLAKLSHRQTEVAARLRSFLMAELEILSKFTGDEHGGFARQIGEKRALPSGSPASARDVAPAMPFEGVQAVQPSAPSAAVVPVRESVPESLKPAPAPPVPDAPRYEEPKQEAPAAPNPDLGVRWIETEPTPAPPEPPPAATTPYDDLDLDALFGPVSEGREGDETADPRDLTLSSDPAPTNDSDATMNRPVWSLRSIITGAPESARPRTRGDAESEKEKIRRILEDLD